MNIHDRTGEFRLSRWCVHLGAATALLVVAMLYYVLAVGPMTARRHSQLAEIQRLDAMQQAAVGTGQTESDLRRMLATVQRREAQLLQRIPQNAAEHEFLQAITHAADQASVQIVDYGREGVDVEPTHSALRIGVRCRGGYAQVCRLLETLERLERLVIIEHVNVTSDLSSDDLAAEIKIVLYYGLNAPTAEEAANV